jgi:hypothetical protein
MTVVVEQFDPVSIKNASVQFKEAGGTHAEGTPFGAIGTIGGETTLLELIKRSEGVEVAKKVKPQKMTLTLSARVKAQVLRDVYGIKTEELKPGVYSYGKDSVGKEFILTADEIDEFEDITKLVAFPNCTAASGFSFSIENGASEVAELSVTFEAYPDEYGEILYEAYVSELEDTTVQEQWHTAFTRTLVEAIPAP